MSSNEQISINGEENPLKRRLNPNQSFLIRLTDTRGCLIAEPPRPTLLEPDNVDSIGFNENFTKSSRPLLQLH